MRGKVRFGKRFHLRSCALLLALGAAIGAPGILSSQIAPDRKVGSLAELGVESERFVLNPAIEEWTGGRSRLAPAADATWSAFRSDHGDWVAYLDLRSGRLESAEGEGIPWVPGTGNRLNAAVAGKIDLAALEGIARRFVAEQVPLLGLDEKELALSSGRSGAVSDSLWYVDFDVRRAGIPIEGARVLFRVSHGNLIQFGLENVPPQGVAVPKVGITAEQAGKIVAERVGGLLPGRDQILDAGSLHLLPSAVRDDRLAEGFAFGKGYGLVAVWDLTFRRDGDPGTWRARVDATTGELLSLSDLNRYAQATGGMVGSSPAAPDVVRAMPWADLSNVAFTNSNGRFDFSGTPLTSMLDGQFVNVLDTCGSIAATTSGPSGNLSFGSSASGTDCATPGVGGAGNTRSTRTSFFWVNRAKEIARGWLPSVNWLFFTLRTNVNLSQTCNAYWSGSTLNFFKSGGGCNNSGEVPGVAIHELGHGLDANDGNGESSERASGELNGDVMATLVLHKSCIGEGFRSTACTGYGDACTACTGVRDIDWARHTSNAPHTVANFVQSTCPTTEDYPGPCGREGHCESHLPTEAVWDFVNRDLPNQNLGGAAAWNLMERLWFATRSTATQSFTCNTTTPTWSSSGCNVGSLWKALRAADDDDGNLANGTPHGAALFIAFNRHGMACISDPGTATTFAACTPPPAPPLTLTPDDQKVSLSWGPPANGARYDVYRNDVGCDAGFVRFSKNSSLSSGQDLTVVNGQTYFYQVVAHASGNEACASAPSPCKSVVPNVPQLPLCNPPGAPTVTATAVGPNRIDLSWNAVPGAIRYRVFIGFSPTGPFTDYGTTMGTTFTNGGTICNVAHYYLVRAEKADTCVSPNSAMVTATTLPCPSCHKATLYSNDFESGTGLADWVQGPVVAGFGTKNWRGVQACTAASGTGIFRFGGATCTGDYGTGEYAYAQPNGVAGIAIPYGSTAPRLTFSHRRAFEAGLDGALLAVSIDGGPYTPVPASAITSGGYDGTIGSSCAPEGTSGLPVWTGSSAAFTDTTVDLSGLCSDFRGGCGGHTLGLAFTAITDCAGTDDGWFLDDVAVTACVP